MTYNQNKFYCYQKNQHKRLILSEASRYQKLDLRKNFEDPNIYADRDFLFCCVCPKAAHHRREASLQRHPATIIQRHLNNLKEQVTVKKKSKIILHRHCKFVVFRSEFIAKTVEDVDMQHFSNILIVKTEIIVRSNWWKNQRTFTLQHRWILK